MAYKTTRCSCPADSKLVFLDHLRDCPEVANDLDPAETPPPPQELIAYICASCGKPHLSRAPLMKCHNSGRWVQEGVHYYSQRYALVPD